MKTSKKAQLEAWVHSTAGREFEGTEAAAFYHTLPGHNPTLKTADWQTIWRLLSEMPGVTQVARGPRGGTYSLRTTWRFNGTLTVPLVV